MCEGGRCNSGNDCVITLVVIFFEDVLRLI